MDWKNILKLGGGTVFGLDVGSSSVKAVQVRREGDTFKVVAAGKVDIGASEEEGVAAENIRTVKAIHESCDQAGIKNRYAVCSVCGPEVAVRYFKFPDLSADELASAIQLEAEQVCPFSLENAVVDHQLVPDGTGGRRGVLVAATNKVVNRVNRLVKEASYSPVLMDVDGLALLNCLNCSEGQEQGKAASILNVGNAYSNLIIAGENSVPFVRDCTYAGKSIMTSLHKQTGFELERLLNILFHDDNFEEQQLLNSALEIACEGLIQDITSTLRFYSAQKKELYTEKIYVCGGFSRAKGFVEILNEQLPATVVLWDPFEKIECDSNCVGKELIEKEGPTLAVAAGLAMRSI